MQVVLQMFFPHDIDLGKKQMNGKTFDRQKEQERK